jgi:hypothetical protein
MDPADLAALRTLVDPARLRIMGRLASRPATADELAAELRSSLPAVNRSLELLDAARLAERVPDRAGAWRARPDRVGELARALAALEREAAGGEGGAGSGEQGWLEGPWPHGGESLAATLDRIGATPEERKTLRGYLVDGRLETIPAQPKKRQVVLRFLLERVFTEDRDYPEKEVNQRLALFHPDVASLRRYLVDEGYATREGGRYRRR